MYYTVPTCRNFREIHVEVSNPKRQTDISWELKYRTIYILYRHRYRYSLKEALLSVGLNTVRLLTGTVGLNNAGHYPVGRVAVMKAAVLRIRIGIISRIIRT